MLIASTVVQVILQIIMLIVIQENFDVVTHEIEYGRNLQVSTRRVHECSQ